MTHPPEPQPLSAEKTAEFIIDKTEVPDALGTRWKADYIYEFAKAVKDTISTLTAERDAALANAMPEGCVAVCRMCGKNAAWYGPNCEAANCPLMRRLKAVISAAAKTTQEPT